MNFEQWLQSRLTAHGYAVGPINGSLDAVTIAAIKAFQKARGLETTGKADGSTVAMLRNPSSAVLPESRAGIPSRDAEVAEATRNHWPRQNECLAFYGAVGTGQVQIEIPFDMVLAWDRSVRIRKMTLHAKVADSARRVFSNIANLYSPQDRAGLGLDVFGGSLNVRRMRGGSAYSMHSWGIAVDFDPERNQLNWKAPKARLSHADALPFWKAWEAEGWLSLGRARDFDWMHIQAARL
ncbi:MAG: peptidoglycan-binding protein [Rhizobium sp.]|nr:peptidoglycan-binding protein [Rhizobium sp.]